MAKKDKASAQTTGKKQHPDWSSLNPREVEARIVELSKTGKTTSEIGMVLRDQYAVPDVKVATGKRVSKVLAEKNIKPEIPEDLRSLIHTALQMKKHIDVNKKDLKSKRDLQLTESKIRRLTKYYHGQNRLPKDWRYSLEQAKLMFE